MEFKDEEMMDIQNICKKVCEKNLTVKEGNLLLKKYGLEKSAFSLDGKAILYFSDGKILRFGNLVKKSYSNEENASLNLFDDSHSWKKL